MTTSNCRRETIVILHAKQDQWFQIASLPALSLILVNRHAAAVPRFEQASKGNGEINNARNSAVVHHYTVDRFRSIVSVLNDALEK
jgi:hypothetical protein